MMVRRGMVEPLRSTLLSWSQDEGKKAAHRNRGEKMSHAPSYRHLLMANLVAGGLAGGAAAAVTTPFDVVKTHMQVVAPRAPGASVGSVMRELWRQQGFRGLMVGAGPRSVRAAYACATVIASYELLKAALANSQTSSNATASD